jgi:hypothetical protein
MTEYNASDTRQVKAAIKRSRTERELDDGVLIRLMTDPSGRAWVWRFLSSLHAFHTPYTGENNATNFRCGEQSVGLALITDLLRACPDQFIFMMKEANDGGRTDNDDRHERDSSNSGRDDSGSGDDNVQSDYDPNDIGSGGDLPADYH